jgi:SAM-dependent methyltransferase
MIVELGPGTRPHRLTDIGIDLHHPIGDVARDASIDRWPIEDGEADVVYSSHFMEHVAHGAPLIHVMNEAHRVLKSGGAFIARHPAVGYTAPDGSPQSNHIGWQPWADPTHVSFWWMPEAYLYFCAGPFRPNADYGIHVWRVLGDFVFSETADEYLFDIREIGPSFWAMNEGWEAIVRLIKP